MTGSADAASPDRPADIAPPDALSTGPTSATSGGGDGPPKRKRSALRLVLLIAVALVILLVTVYTVTLTFVARSYRIPSEAMEPTLHGCAGCEGDHVIVSKLAYLSSSPQPGDVIVFKGPPAWNIGYKSIRSDDTVARWVQNALSVIGLVPPDENDVVKRVIAVGGQTVECRANTGLTVDGKKLTEPYLSVETVQVDPQVYPCLGPEYGPVKVPDGRLWVMGDNRTHSADSRAHCTSLPEDALKGVLCTGDPMNGTIPVDNVIGKVWIISSPSSRQGHVTSINPQSGP